MYASSSQIVYEFDLTRLEIDENFDVRYLSDIPGPEERWKKSKEFYLLALSSFSRILFDEHKRFGVLEFSMTCGRQCASTGLVYLKNENDIWTVDGLETILVE